MVIIKFRGKKYEKFFKNMTLLPKDLQCALHLILLCVSPDIGHRAGTAGGTCLRRDWAFVKCDSQALNYS